MTDIRAKIWKKYNDQKNLERARYAPGKVKCLLCTAPRFYMKLGAHIRETHRMTAREYREMFKLEVSKALIHPRLKRKLSKNALENKMDEQLKRTGKKTRFTPGHTAIYTKSPITLRRVSELGKRTGALNIKHTRNHKNA